MWRRSQGDFCIFSAVEAFGRRRDRLILEPGKMRKSRDTGKLSSNLPSAVHRQQRRRYAGREDEAMGRMHPPFDGLRNVTALDDALKSGQHLTGRRGLREFDKEDIPPGFSMTVLASRWETRISKRQKLCGGNDCQVKKFSSGLSVLGEREPCVSLKPAGEDILQIVDTPPRAVEEKRQDRIGSPLEQIGRHKEHQHSKAVDGGKGAQVPPSTWDSQSDGVGSSCRNVDEFEPMGKIGEGTYGCVYRARNKKTGEIVVLKRLKLETEKKGFPLTALREIRILSSLHHPSVVKLKEVVVGSSTDSVFIVMEYMEYDLQRVMRRRKTPFNQSEAKCLLLQLLAGVEYIHGNWVLHRDLKPANLVLNSRWDLKICDLGLARRCGGSLKADTPTVVSLWYKAPELLLAPSKYRYSTAIDMWSVGCIMAELLTNEPLFDGKSEIDQICKIVKTLGIPNEKTWPEFVNFPFKCYFPRQLNNMLRQKFPATAFAGRIALSRNGFNLLSRLLTYDPAKRISASEALEHAWFCEFPLPLPRGTQKP